jgi:hypothetical protein
VLYRLEMPEALPRSRIEASSVFANRLSPIPFALQNERGRPCRGEDNARCWSSVTPD